jgi:hypothetical protein
LRLPNCPSRPAADQQGLHRRRQAARLRQQAQAALLQAGLGKWHGLELPGSTACATVR